MEFYHTTCGFADIFPRGQIPPRLCNSGTVSVLFRLVVSSFCSTYIATLVCVQGQLTHTYTHTQMDGFQHVYIFAYKHVWLELMICDETKKVNDFFSLQRKSHDLICQFTARLFSCRKILRWSWVYLAVVTLETRDERTAFLGGLCCCWCHNSAPLACQVILDDSCIKVTSDHGLAKRIWNLFATNN